MIRDISSADLIKAAEIHEKYYKKQFDLPDFKTKFSCAYSIIGLDGELISLAGVRPILEMVVLTDKDKSVRERYKAVYQILDMSKYVAIKKGFDELHAFVQEEHWMDVMLSRGLERTKGQSLVIGV